MALSRRQKTDLCALDVLVQTQGKINRPNELDKLVRFMTGVG